MSSPSIISVSLSREVPQLLRGFLQALILKMYRKKLNPLTSCPNEMTRKKLLLFLKLIKTGRSVKLDETTKKRRATVAEMLNNRKDKEIIQKLTSGAQFLNYAKEDHLELKRKLLDRLDKEDSDFKESTAKINKTMESVGESISESMMLLAQFLRPANASHMPSPSMESQHMPHYVAYNQQPFHQVEQSSNMYRRGEAQDGMPVFEQSLGHRTSRSLKNKREGGGYSLRLHLSCG